MNETKKIIISDYDQTFYIDSNSNIAKFYGLFDVKDGSDAINDILNFIFEEQECNDYNNLTENTTLQKILKKQLLENKELKIG